MLHHTATYRILRGGRDVKWSIEMDIPAADEGFVMQIALYPHLSGDKRDPVLESAWMALALFYPTLWVIFSVK